MGMYDDVRFDYRMPDGYDRPDFQTKDLDCACDMYEINAQGRLVRLSSCGYPDDVLLPLGDLHFCGDLNIYTISGYGTAATSTWHDYTLTFVEGTLVVIKCNQTGGELLFDRTEVGLHQKQARAAMQIESDRLLAKMETNLAERKSRRQSLFNK